MLIWFTLIQLGKAFQGGRQANILLVGIENVIPNTGRLPLLPCKLLATTTAQAFLGRRNSTRTESTKLSTP